MGAEGLKAAHDGRRRASGRALLMAIQETSLPKREEECYLHMKKVNMRVKFELAVCRKFSLRVGESARWSTDHSSCS